MTIQIFACGDIVNETANIQFIDEHLKKLITGCDISICNLEAPVATENSKAINKAGPHLKQASRSIEYLKNSGFTLTSIANNHIYDYGESAFDNTLKLLEKKQLEYVGGGSDFKASYNYKVINQKNVKIGILAACENEFGCLYEQQNRGGYAWLLHPKIEDNIRQLKKEVDLIILIAHAGVEEIDFPIREWRERYKRFCDIGVDVIIGHHPHVPQGYEKHNNSLIFYSLGNFYFDTKGFKDKSDDSYSIILNYVKGQKVDFNIIYHKKIAGTTCLVDE